MLRICLFLTLLEKWCHEECYNLGNTCHWLPPHTTLSDAQYTQCSCVGIPSELEGITGGSTAGGGLPMGLTEVDNCTQIDHDDQMYGWNKNPCCGPAGQFHGYYGTSGNCPYTSQFSAVVSWGFPPGGEGCQCCCHYPLNWGGANFPHAPRWPPSYENKCHECYPKESHRVPFEAGCSRVTSSDLYAAWQNLTSGGWIPDSFYMLADDRLGGLNGGDNTFFVENSLKMVCGRDDNNNVVWKRAIDDGEAPIRTPIGGAGDEFIDAFIQILDEVNNIIPSDDDCFPNIYTLSNLIGAPYGENARWLDRVVKLLDSYDCDTDYYIDPDCPKREPWYHITSLEFLDANGVPTGADPAQFFDCPSWAPSPCWSGAGRRMYGLKKSGIEYSCDDERKWSAACTTAHGSTSLLHTNRVRENYDRIREHPFGFGSVFDEYPYYQNGCLCCNGCDLPLNNASFTINSTSDCWGY